MNLHEALKHSDIAVLRTVAGTYYATSNSIFLETDNWASMFIHNRAAVENLIGWQPMGYPSTDDKH